MRKAKGRRKACAWCGSQEDVDESGCCPAHRRVVEAETVAFLQWLATVASDIATGADADQMEPSTYAEGRTALFAVWMAAKGFRPDRLAGPNETLVAGPA